MSVQIYVRNIVVSDVLASFLTVTSDIDVDVVVVVADAICIDDAGTFVDVETDAKIIPSV